MGGRDLASETFPGDGEMAALMRVTDWSRTRLGPLEAWPQALRTMVRVALGSRFPMLIWWGPDLLHLYNDAYLPILRHKHPASLAAPAAEVWAEVWDLAGPMARSVLAGGPATWSENLRLLIRAEGGLEEAFFTFSYSPIPGDDGKVAGILNTVQETTLQMQGERQIRMLHDLAAKTADAKTAGEACRAAEKALAAYPEDLPFVRIRLTREGTIPAGAQVLPLLRPGKAEPQGWLVAGLSPNRKPDARYRGLLQAVADRVSAAITNASTYEALAEIDRAKTAFFSNVSHELRTPLTLILGPVEDALGKSLSGKPLEAVHRNAVRLLKLVNALLDFARLEAGRMKAAFEPTDLAALTARLAGSFRSLVEGAGLTLTVDCPPLPQPVHVDPDLWERIVLNLVSNAFKFTLEGGIRVSLAARGGRVELTVKDTGTGIPASELPRIFERFHRVEGAKGRSFEGSGIGLALVQEMARLHGGAVRVESVEGKGSTFTVSIPMGTSHLPADRIGAPRAASAKPSPYLMEAASWIRRTETPAPEEGTRVLVVDDSADMREYLVGLLSSRWTVEAAPDGRQALEAARARPPDLVLSDVMMPVLDGMGLLKALREDPLTREVPVVLLSARAGEESLVQGLETGADDYLVKPFSARELLARVQTHLDMARMRRRWAADLARANRELEAFSYSVSHDLRAPLRAIDGFSRILQEDFADALGAEGIGHLDRVRESAKRMDALIRDLLELSRIDRSPLHKEKVDVTALARRILAELQAQEPARKAEILVEEGLSAEGDPRLLEIAMRNLLGNAWKFTAKRTLARIEVGRRGEELFVRDNGAGFDMDRAAKLFAPFQRLHPVTEFEGTGIGLATVQRIVDRHGGRIRAEAQTDKGAAFSFTLA